MITNSILLECLSVEQLQQMIGTSVKNGIQEFQNEIKTKDNSEELLSRDETCQFLKIDSSTLWAWTNAGKVKAYGIGARRYYKRSELLENLILLKK
ncbi:helix-turn-helix domain-containing protein [Flavobacterium galactosidilyticum]|uniref:helix-turn-helix domain-containing protein n=1 Tax=Flavobacterium galactosidilyticum TaxID=2893886 RepID=UPI001E58B2A1|nr:helix-turn-helix domain-containing protein [Flavobacterium sp. F-340]UFH45372.1 helix-turn-helix domain-containing protein [Flavobacterium sp. F-340]